MRSWLALLVASGCGLALVLTTHPLAMALTGLVPAVWLAQHSRPAAFLTSSAYFLAASWPVIECAQPFLPLLGQRLLFWLTCCGLLAMPSLLGWTANRNNMLWRAALATITTIVPPMGVIAVANPVAAAGWWFPGTGIPGAIALAFVPPLLLRWPRSTLAALVITSAAMNATYKAPLWSGGWKAVSLAPAPADTDFERLARALDLAEDAGESVLVFPEAYLKSWTDTSAVFFAERLAALKSRGKTIVLGAIAPETFDQRGVLVNYRNVVIGLGANAFTLDQRIPVPIGMWNPFSGRGMRLRPFASGIAMIDGRRVALLICWEQLLPFPALLSLAADPYALIPITRSPSLNLRVSRLQRLYTRAWNRLLTTAHPAACAGRFPLPPNP